MPFTGLVGEAPVGYLTTRYPSGAPAAAVKVPLICVVERAVNPKLVAELAGAVGGKLVISDISSIEPGGWVPADGSFENINTSLLVVPAYEDGKQIVCV